MMCSVVGKVAALAQRLQVVVVAVLGHVVEMRDREYDLRPLAAAVLGCLAVTEEPAVVGRVDLAITFEALERAGILVDAAYDRVAILDETLLAPVTGPSQDARADLRPVLRVAAAIFRLYRHSVLPH